MKTIFGFVKNIFAADEGICCIDKNEQLLTPFFGKQ